MNVQVNIITKGIIMARIYKRHGSSLKAKVALEALKEKKTIGELAQEYSVAPNQITTWKKHVEGNISKIFESKVERNHQDEIDRLHRVIGQITAERDFLVRALNH